MDFAQVETKFKELKEKYDAGAITEDEFKAQLEELMIQDEEGKWWIIGYETGQWYYHDGEKWVRAEPPKPAPVAPTTPTVEPQRAPEALIREEGFLLHLLPTLVGGVVTIINLTTKAVVEITAKFKIAEFKMVIKPTIYIRQSSA